MEELPTHGGSLRVWAQHASNPRPGAGQRRGELLDAGSVRPVWASVTSTTACRRAPSASRTNLLRFLIDCKRAGRRVAAYGAAAKGNTLLNFAGVRPDLLPYVVDASPHKQGRFLPGSRIPVRSPQALLDDRPDVVLILPWNLRDEIVAQLQPVRAWGGRFATAVPELRVD